MFSCLGILHHLEMPPNPGHFLEECAKPPATGFDILILEIDIVCVGGDKKIVCTVIPAGTS